jgi:hypothetical protein
MVKKNSDITVTVIWYLFITAVIGIAFYTVMSFSKPYLKSGYMDEGQCIKWSDDWQYSDSSGDSRRVDMPTELSKPDVDTVYLTKQLPDTIRPGWYMAVYSSFQKVKVYIDGRLVDDYEGNESLLASPLPANEFRFISIGPADSGKVVRIEIETYLKNYTDKRHDNNDAGPYTACHADDCSRKGQGRQCICVYRDNNAAPRCVVRDTGMCQPGYF